MMNQRRRLKDARSQFEYDDDDDSNVKSISAKADRRGCLIDFKLRIQLTRYFLALAALCIIAWSNSRDLKTLGAAFFAPPRPEVCSKQLHSTEALWIAMPAWNDEEGLHSALQSVMDQESSGYSKLKVVVFEDTSPQMLSQEQKDYYRARMDVTFLVSEEKSTNLGSAYGKWKLFEYIRDHALPHEYTFVLDGDDTLVDNTVLRYIYRALAQKKPWFAWGRHKGRYSEQCHGLIMKRGQSFRSARWSFCHPRMFQSHLLHYLKESDFRRDDGSWLQKATDRPFIFTFMELAGRDRIAYMGDKALYNYKMGSHNGLRIFGLKIINGDKQLVNSRPPATRVPETVHVVTCVYDRQNTQEYLDHLMTSELQPGQTLKIHICNNKSDRQHELEQIVADTTERQRKRGDKVHHMDIHDMGGNHGGFSRFLLARRVMEKEYVDYFIMMDDDQYVTPTTVSEVYAYRKPQTYSTWYGKNWDLGEPSYWAPRETMNIDPLFRYQERTDVTSWQYGGTGMSIIDASIFLKQELFEIEQKYLFVEDAWLSHIVQVSGWRIGRLFVKFSDAGREIRVSAGQWTSLKPLKEEFFEKLGYLSCSSRRGWELAKPRFLDNGPPFIAA